jgi:predicted transcriptional regulator of viral defense system
MTTAQTIQLRKAFHRTTVLRGRELAELGFSRVALSDAVRRGDIERIGRGLYTSSDAPTTEKHSYVQVAHMVPNAVFCLLTACRIHDITVQNPFEVWFAIGQKTWMPKITFVGTRVLRFSGPALTEGIEIVRAEGTDLKVYCVAKTVADLFKFRNKFGLDVAIEAMRDALHERKCTPDEIMHYAKICRVAKVIDPYLTTYLAL